ncbi:hypothetical protein GLOTRDRAFT_122567 [Gloeophyllum trabeum ATCC 11539]|uniref:Ion transport domain-containing protein n=1 Tax=Gloeophyllum trabeum (strain ATCC 11539 / FP-39264 / Madison 617) TaxID=670483 RepID=S7RIW3_GLOTA|nr:uncharacterized protein GLOTRDRAFT_122567 [Gloeophyllum trabeum ATCC 11539]EPQ52529.1 hypothetical protein GLOTRDRAFT_122567 [Gloeophyllum trabeum ATCC 11539]
MSSKESNPSSHAEVDTSTKSPPLTRHFPKPAFYILYHIVASCTVSEVTLRVLVADERFWTVAWNMADLALGILVVMTFPLSLSLPSEFVTVHLTVAAACLLFIRIVTHFLRFVLAMRSYATLLSTIDAERPGDGFAGGMLQPDLDDFDLKTLLAEFVTNVSQHVSIATIAVSDMAATTLPLAHVRASAPRRMGSEGKCPAFCENGFLAFTVSDLGIFDVVFIIFNGVALILLGVLGRRPRFVIGVLTASVVLARSIIQLIRALYALMRSNALIPAAGAIRLPFLSSSPVSPSGPFNERAGPIDD